ncbi:MULTISPECIES: hypothetical protein [Stenotrophomonas]|uniref:hypothetical protein n=1 Tax=Stenotrophomonas sp. a6 TaxID=3068322 RepID=UPI001F2F9BBC|nr:MULTISPECIES: hypothetical protein [Stenotrophomonas]
MRAIVSRIKRNVSLMVGYVATESSYCTNSRISSGHKARSLGTKAVSEAARTYAVDRVVHMLALGDGVYLDPFRDIPNLDRRGRSRTFFDLVVQGSLVIGLNFTQRVVPENRKNVPVDYVPAHRAGPVDQPCVGQPIVHRLAESLDGPRPAFPTLFLQRGQDAVENALSHIRQQLACHWLQNSVAFNP